MKTLITFVGDKTDTITDDYRLNLAQVELPDTAQEANLYDLSTMYGYVINGTSARSYKKYDCPVRAVAKNKVEIHLDFYVWPHFMDLGYSLDAALGSISPQEHVELPVDFDAIVKQQDFYDLDYIFNGEIEITTPCINAAGAVVDIVGTTVVGNKIKLDSSVFAVLRVTGKAIGYKHRLTIGFDVVTESNITGLNDSVIASWVGADGKVQTKTLPIKIPKCVNDFLALCPNGLQPRRESISQENETPTVYFSGCNGDFLEVRYER